MELPNLGVESASLRLVSWAPWRLENVLTESVSTNELSVGLSPVHQVVSYGESKLAFIRYLDSQYSLANVENDWYAHAQ